MTSRPHQAAANGAKFKQLSDSKMPKTAFLNLVKCRGRVRGLLDPRSFHKEDLSLIITVTRDVYIPCDSDKSDQIFFFFFFLLK